MSDIIDELKSGCDWCMPRCHDCNEVAKRAAAEIRRMRDYLEPLCHCPCCDQDQACLDGCTWEKDAIVRDGKSGWERMMEARAARWGE